MRSEICAAMVAAGLIVTGCGGSKTVGNSTTETTVTETATAEAKAKVDVCKLLTADEVFAITGDKLIGTQGSDVDGCNYRTSEDESLQVQVDLTDGKGQMDTVRKSAQLLGGIGDAVANTGDVGGDVKNALKPDKAATPAIGDEVVWVANNALAVRRGDTFVQVTPPVAHDPATHKGLPLIPNAERRKIAQAAAEKLFVKIGK